MRAFRDRTSKSPQPVQNPYETRTEPVQNPYETRNTIPLYNVRGLL